MTRRGRIVSFGSAAVLVLAGLASALFAEGLAGQLLTMTLMLGGLAGAVFLLFLEVGLSEEAERAREREDRGPEQGQERARQGASRLRRPPRRRRPQ